MNIEQAQEYVEELMSKRGIPGKCAITVDSDNVRMVDFTRDDGVLVPVRVGGKIAEGRTLKDICETAFRRFVRANSQ